MQIGILKNTARVELCQDLLVQLKVPVMAEFLGKLAIDPAHQNMTLVEAVATMASQELESRAQKRQERFIQRSGLRELSVWNQADVTKVILTKERNLKGTPPKHQLSQFAGAEAGDKKGTSRKAVPFHFI